jgi:hypothetical protein
VREYSRYLDPKIGLFSADVWTLVAVAVWLLPIFLIITAFAAVAIKLDDGGKRVITVAYEPFVREGDHVRVFSRRGNDYTDRVPRIANALASLRVKSVTIDGEGIPGVLVSAERGWFYKPNLGEGRLASPTLMRSLPDPAELSGVQQLMDLGGDGNLDLVSYTPPLAGYFERTPNRDWAPFVALRGIPNIDLNDPNLRFIDLDGDVMEFRFNV